MAQAGEFFPFGRQWFYLTGITMIVDNLATKGARASAATDSSAPIQEYFQIKKG